MRPAGVEDERGLEARAHPLDQRHRVAAEARAAVVGREVEPPAENAEQPPRLREAHQQRLPPRAEHELAAPARPRQCFGGEQERCHAAAAGDQHRCARGRERKAMPERPQHLDFVPAPEGRERPGAEPDRHVQESQHEPARRAPARGDAHRAREQRPRGGGPEQELDELAGRGHLEISGNPEVEPPVATAGRDVPGDPRLDLGESRASAGSARDRARVAGGRRRGLRSGQ